MAYDITPSILKNKYTAKDQGPNWWSDQQSSKLKLIFPRYPTWQKWYNLGITKMPGLLIHTLEIPQEESWHSNNFERERD